VRAQGSRSLAVMERLQRSTGVVPSSIVTELELAAASGLGEVQPDRVVRTEHLTAALECVLGQSAGRLGLAQRGESESQGGCRQQGDRMVRAQHPATAFQGVLA
jgi:hypothetical protein